MEDREVLMPADEKTWLELRTKDITSTEVSALFGLSPYMTPYELWYRKHGGTVSDFSVNDRMKWGTRLQNSIAAGVCEDNAWGYRAMKEYIRAPHYQIGSSFDFCITEPFTAILEIKNVDSLAFKDGWIVSEETIEAPMHIELQVQHQMLVSGIKKAYIAALIGGNKVVLIERVADSAVHHAIIQKTQEFWKSISNNEPPAPDFKRDAKFIVALNQSVTPEKTIEATHRITVLAENYQQVGAIEKDAKEKKEAIKAEIYTLIGDAEKCKGEKFSISAGFVGPAHIEFDREGYRNFKVTFKKEKQDGK